MSTKNTEDKATYLTFMLDRETFAIPVANVREVLDLAAVTRVPRTPDFMRGVINLRGGVVPVVDMRKKFNLPDAEDTVDTCIIVVEVNVDGDAMVIGALADSVQEVFELADELGPEKVIYINNSTVRLRAIVVVDNTACGQGCSTLITCISISEVY